MDDSSAPPSKFDIRVLIGVMLLAGTVWFTWQTLQELSERRRLRTELAEIGHVRYGLLNAGEWVTKVVPILDANIDALDLNVAKESLRPMVVQALYRLLDNVKEKMSAPPSNAPQNGGLGGLMAQGNALMANMMIASLKPHVPEYADVVLAEFGKPDVKEALKKYIHGVIAEGAKNTFGSADMKWYDYMLHENGCSDVDDCRQKIGARIQAHEEKITQDFLAALGMTALAFALLMIGRPLLGRAGTVVLLLFCVTLLVGGVLNPMIEVEAKISKLSMTFLGHPITFQDQVLYFQSKSVLEVFHTLITMGKPDMWIVGMLVLMFSVVFPILKTLSLSVCLIWPSLLRGNRVVRFLALESSKWSMADVMVLAIFMSFVAFNGLIANTMSGLSQTGADLVIPTNSSKLLAGYYLFIGYCLASLFLSKKLEHGIRTNSAS